jgi:non-homologous end joining protein Ku
MEIKGLDDVFQEYFDKGKTPDEIVSMEMINDLRKQNFIPEDVEDLYDEALLDEYGVYFSTRKKDRR